MYIYVCVNQEKERKMIFFSEIQLYLALFVQPVCK